MSLEFEEFLDGFRVKKELKEMELRAQGAKVTQGETPLQARQSVRSAALLHLCDALARVAASNKTRKSEK